MLLFIFPQLHVECLATSYPSHPNFGGLDWYYLIARAGAMINRANILLITFRNLAALNNHVISFNVAFAIVVQTIPIHGVAELFTPTKLFYSSAIY